MSDSPGLVDFVAGQFDSVLYKPSGQVKLFNLGAIFLGNQITEVQEKDDIIVL